MALAIELQNVAKEYPRDGASPLLALDGINLAIPRGQFVGLAGMNGSGKSTLARLINGLLMPTAGKVLVDGLNTTRRDTLQAIRQRVGMVFQNPDNQIISPIVEEDVAFGPQNLGLSPAEVNERVDWALQATGLQDLRLNAPHLLSGGQKQRVAIAAALAMRPSYLVLDEPTSMLDPKGRQELLTNLQDLHKKHGLTIILITHNIEDLLFAERLILLREGRIVMDDRPNHIFLKEAELRSAGLKPPDIFQIANNLRRRGYRINENIVTVKQMVEFLCQL